MLPSRISVPRSSELLEQEDIFDSALNALFTDDAQNCHGTPGQSVVYSSPRFGDLLLKIPVHPDVDEGRKLFAHYLWNAGIVVAAGIEYASIDQVQSSGKDSEGQEPDQNVWERKYWDVRGQNVLELGSGTALPSLIAALSNAKSATITDHPSSPAITNDAIVDNIKVNFFKHADTDSDPQNPIPRSSSDVIVHGYVWGETSFMSSKEYGKSSYPQPENNSFNKIIIADCLWMPSQHVNLVKTILHYLAHDAYGNTKEVGAADSMSENNGSTQKDKVNCALVVAGFHTGRAIVAEFLRIATGSTKADDQTLTDENGCDDQEEDTEEVKSVIGSLRADSIFEIDVNANCRPWLPVRAKETREQAKRWCVVAALVKR